MAETLEQYKARIRGFSEGVFAPTTGQAHVKIAVIEPKADAKQHQLEDALRPKESGQLALKPVMVSMPVKGFPESLFGRTIIPLIIRAPTARLTSDHYGTGYGMPWTTSPASLVIGAAPIGALLVMIGRQVAAQMAIQGSEYGIGELKKRYNRRDIQFRVMTGQSEAGKGNIVRPRGEGGEIPEGTNPYEDPDDFTWWQPWTWF